ncbi:putative inner membrane protein [Salmonella enterica subsp. enterica serovar Daytona]|uniref:Putative inner membrane protein n=1 Tax=Salmonella enterica subsp. enterica serovar Daytona TaxID=1962639 RepID=A0A447JDQ7_SALET|nr:putative inner membrane protein [Salmonella enterica subsp. enterica serovar Daytona]
MPGCISACSCVVSSTPTDPKAPPKPKWIELKGYCVTCTSQEDIRPPKEGEPKQKMTPRDLVLLRGLLKDLGVTQKSLARPDSKTQ